MSYKHTKIIRILSLCLSFLLFFEQTGLAQGLPSALTTPLPTPPLLRYLSVNSSNPFNYFNFLLDKGLSPITVTGHFPSQLRESSTMESVPPSEGTVPDLTQEAKKLINYFFLGITLPDKAFWVNLRPDEPGRITSEELSQTDLGKVLLEQDLRLKKDVSKLLHPHHPQGKEFWTRLYETIGKNKAKQAQITTSNRVWIVPDKAVVLETEDGALVVEARLKVLLENEYLQAKSIEHRAKDQDKIQTLSESLMKQIILPALTEEVNTSPAYAPLRQIYHSLILAQWFKSKELRAKSKESISNPYALAIDKGFLKGLESELPWSKQALWQEYLESYSKGEYKLKERLAGLNRMYFSGGVYLACDGSNGSSPITVIKGGAGAAGSPLSLIEDDKLIQQLPNMVPVVEETPAVIPKKGEFPTGKSTVVELPEKEPTKEEDKEASFPMRLSAEPSQPKPTGVSFSEKKETASSAVESKRKASQNIQQLHFSQERDRDVFTKDNSFLVKIWLRIWKIKRWFAKDLIESGLIAYSNKIPIEQVHPQGARGIEKELQYVAGRLGFKLERIILLPMEEGPFYREWQSKEWAAHVMAGLPGYIFLNLESTRPLLTSIIHEWMHDIFLYSEGMPTLVETIYSLEHGIELPEAYAPLFAEARESFLRKRDIPSAAGFAGYLTAMPYDFLTLDSTPYYIGIRLAGIAVALGEISGGKFETAWEFVRLLLKHHTSTAVNMILEAKTSEKIHWLDNSQRNTPIEEIITNFSLIGKIAKRIVIYIDPKEEVAGATEISERLLPRMTKVNPHTQAKIGDVLIVLPKTFMTTDRKYQEIIIHHELTHLIYPHEPQVEFLYQILLRSVEQPIFVFLMNDPGPKMVIRALADTWVLGNLLKDNHRQEAEEYMDDIISIIKAYVEEAQKSQTVDQRNIGQEFLFGYLTTVLPFELAQLPDDARDSRQQLEALFSPFFSSATTQRIISAARQEIEPRVRSHQFYPSLYGICQMLSGIDKAIENTNLLPIGVDVKLPPATKSSLSLEEIDQAIERNPATKVRDLADLIPTLDNPQQLQSMRILVRSFVITLSDDELDASIFFLTLNSKIKEFLENKGWVVEYVEGGGWGVALPNAAITLSLSILGQEVEEIQLKLGGVIRVPKYIIRYVATSPEGNWWGMPGRAGADFTLKLQARPTTEQVRQVIKGLYPEASEEAVEIAVLFSQQRTPPAGIKDIAGWFKTVFVLNPGYVRTATFIRRFDPQATWVDISGAWDYIRPAEDPRADTLLSTLSEVETIRLYKEYKWQSLLASGMSRNDPIFKKYTSSPLVTESSLGEALQPDSSAGETVSGNITRLPVVLEPEEYGGIDLSQIELTLKDEKFVSSLNPAERQILLAAKYFKDGWESLTLLYPVRDKTPKASVGCLWQPISNGVYIHQIMLMLKDNLIKDIQNRDLLFGILRQLQIKDFLDPQALNFLSLLKSQQPISDLKIALHR